MNLMRWRRFSWDLKAALKQDVPALPAFQVRPATREDERVLREVIVNAVTLDLGWGEVFKGFRSTLEQQLSSAFDFSPAPAVVVAHGQRVIGASLLSTDPDAEYHLLSGPCVLSEYRNRGIGSTLLLRSLEFLHDAGLELASGICREGTPVCKFVFSKFGSTSSIYEPETVALETKMP